MPPSIGPTDISSIGRTYAEPRDTQKMRTRAGPVGTFWDRVREALKDKGLPATQAAAGKRFGVSQPTISEDWQRPGSGPAIEKAVRIAWQLDVCVEWLYTGRPPKHPGGPSGDAYAAELSRIWPGLSEDTKRDLLGAVRLKAAAEQKPKPAAPFTPENSRRGMS